MKAQVYITLKTSVLDPQGSTVQRALAQMDYTGVSSVRIGKFMEIELDTSDEDEARALVDDMCHKLLVNPNIEEYRFTLQAD